MDRPDGFVDIPGYENSYAINKEGFVYSYNKRAMGGRELPNRILKTAYAGKYLCVCLHKNDCQKIHKIHRLVAMVFLPNPNGFICVNHKDGDKLNNRADNLEWCTHSHNQKHAYDIGIKKATTKQKSKAGYCNRKLSWEEVEKIRNMHKTGEYSINDLGKMFCGNIRRIVRNISYKEEAMAWS